MITKATPADAGCYVDGWWGQYAVAHMISRAEEFGYGTAEQPGATLADPATRRRLDDQQALVHLAGRHLASMGSSGAPRLSDDEYEVLSGAADDVEQWLNDNVAPEGYSFGWFEGEFYLWADETWEDPFGSEES